jgi:hypothetical protein
MSLFSFWNNDVGHRFAAASVHFLPIDRQSIVLIVASIRGSQEDEHLSATS